MCDKTEKAALTVLAESIRQWVQDGNTPSSFEDDHALYFLCCAGIRPSSLSADLDHLIWKAHRGIAAGRL